MSFAPFTVPSRLTMVNAPHTFSLTLSGSVLLLAQHKPLLLSITINFQKAFQHSWVTKINALHSLYNLRDHLYFIHGRVVYGLPCVYLPLTSVECLDMVQSGNYKSTMYTTCATWTAQRLDTFLIFYSPPPLYSVKVSSLWSCR